MAHSLAMIYIHAVFSTKNRKPFFKNENIREDLHSYIAKIISEQDSLPIEIGGHEDHVHVLFNLSENVSLDDLLNLIKTNSSKWLKTQGEEFAEFQWQSGYGAVTIGEPDRIETIDHIKNQDEYHKNITFQEEFILFLKENDIDYNEQHLWG